MQHHVLFKYTMKQGFFLEPPPTSFRVHEERSSSNEQIFDILVIFIVQCVSLGLTHVPHSDIKLKTELLISFWASLWCSSCKALWASWRLIYLNKISPKWQDNISHFTDRQQRHTGNSQCWATQDPGRGVLSRFVIICTFKHSTHSL